MQPRILSKANLNTIIANKPTERRQGRKFILNVGGNPQLSRELSRENPDNQ